MSGLAFALLALAFVIRIGQVKPDGTTSTALVRGGLALVFAVLAVLAMRYAFAGL